MYNVAKRITNNTDDAQDAVQDAFISAFQKIQQYKGESTFGAWLKRIVINKSLSLIQSKKRIDFKDSEQLELADDASPPFENNGFEYSIEDVKKAVGQLADGYRSVLSLYLFEGYDHAEIAEILGISLSTSKTQYIRAKKKLKENLAHGRQYQQA